MPKTHAQREMAEKAAALKAASSPHNAPIPHPERRIDASEVRQICGGTSNMWVHRRLNDSDFPRPIKISGRRFWREREVLAWLDAQEVV